MANSWFPGHMAKAIREIKPLLKLIDVVIEVVDARAPKSSSNPLIEQLAKGKSRIVLLNKSDLSDQGTNHRWTTYFKGQGMVAVCSDAVKGVGIDISLKALDSFSGNARIKPRALVIGMPNVGKSTLINRYAKRLKAKTGDKPGITRGKQWIDIGSSELLDTPGLMPLRIDDQDSWMRLSVLGIINDDLFSHEQAASFLVDYLIRGYKDALVGRYGLSDDSMSDPMTAISEIGRKRGCLIPGGEIDLDKTYMLIIRDMRSGRLGRISLESPDANGEGGPSA